MDVLDVLLTIACLVVIFAFLPEILGLGVICMALFYIVSFVSGFRKGNS